MWERVNVVVGHEVKNLNSIEFLVVVGQQECSMNTAVTEVLDFKFGACNSWGFVSVCRKTSLV